MACDRYREQIHELVDGTLGPIRAAELEQHLATCPSCRALANDLQRIHAAATTLDTPRPRDHVWLQIAGRLRQEGRVHDRPETPHASRGNHYMWLGIAAALVLAVGAALFMLRPRGGENPVPTTASTQAGNPSPGDSVQSGVEDLRQAERLLQSGIAKLKEGMGSDEQALPVAAASTLDRNLQILDQAIAESSAALQQEPQNVAARTSLFDALQRKIALLQDTIALMNEMRKGNAAGAAQLVDGNKPPTRM
jgi:anti-sigma factor RsiW